MALSSSHHHLHHPKSQTHSCAPTVKCLGDWFWGSNLCPSLNRTKHPNGATISEDFWNLFWCFSFGRNLAISLDQIFAYMITHGFLPMIVHRHRQYEFCAWETPHCHIPCAISIISFLMLLVISCHITESNMDCLYVYDILTIGLM